ncbi:ROK family protein [Rhodobacter sp. KR11]|uniref:ROK family protein n=1 Tax=Rhodobacter sp. KR11 TaxID=2974588 RepID=UPI002223C866|nr:ROK family protein [Rhodobacter sp. KR11]MCW1917172.1 ROK family protein [Rhodobacter sp. KR11]
MIIAAGIDLGGTKIEAQVFDATWAKVDTRRVPTPKDYNALVAEMAAAVAWAEGFAPGLPVGIAAAGLVNPLTGLALTANLPATGRPFPADIATAAGRGVVYINDCRAQALSEAQFGAARGFKTALALNLGTGLAGGIVVNGRLLEGPSGTGGEFGHFALPAHLTRDLPLVACGCGRMGCTETLIAGPGLSRLLHHRTGRQLRAEEIVAGRADPDLAAVWQTWLGLTAELIHTLIMVVDPGCVVLAGGLSRAPGLVGDLSDALTRVALPGYGAPPILLAEGGDTTGARGAAFAAFAQGRA